MLAEVIRNDVTRFAGYKFLIDGQGPTSFTHQPHSGHEWQMTTWEHQTFKDTIKSLHDTGLQICVHCIGDAAADLVLETYESAMNSNPRPDPRHRIEHAVLTTPQSTQKMKDLDVVVSTQPAFIYLFGDGWLGLYGEERKDRIMVTKEWLEAGVHLTIGSDAPSTPFYNPQATLVRTNAEDNELLGKTIAKKLNKSRGPVAVLWPTKGLSTLDLEGKPYWDPDADAALYRALITNFNEKISFIKVDAHINSSAFADRVIKALNDLAHN